MRYVPIKIILVHTHGSSMRSTEAVSAHVINYLFRIFCGEYFVSSLQNNPVIQFKRIYGDVLAYIAVGGMRAVTAVIIYETIFTTGMAYHRASTGTGNRFQHIGYCDCNSISKQGFLGVIYISWEVRVVFELYILAVM
jgi:hypothetical protein